MEVFWWLFAVVVMALGLIGTVIPNLAGHDDHTSGSDSSSGGIGPGPKPWLECPHRDAFAYALDLRD
jgi:hypothetical protein